MPRIKSWEPGVRERNQSMRDMGKQKPLGRWKTTHHKEAGVRKDASFKTVSKEKVLPTASNAS